jgi:hypothetical protein
MRTQQNIDTWITTLRYLVDDKTTTDGLRNIITTTLATYDRSLKLHSQEVQTANEIMTTLRKCEKELHPQLVEHLRAGKRNVLDATATQIQQLRKTWETAQIRTIATRKAHDQITGEICGGLIISYAAELLLWVATRRNSEPVTCGEIDALPAPVQLVYRTINPQWRTDWEPALTLPDIRSLPLIYNAAWGADIRASLTWVWEQVANGHTQKVPHPADKRPNPPCTLLAPTRRVTTMPAVPPAPTTANTRRSQF